MWLLAFSIWCQFFLTEIEPVFQSLLGGIEQEQEQESMRVGGKTLEEWEALFCEPREKK